MDSLMMPIEFNRDLLIIVLQMGLTSTGIGIICLCAITPSYIYWKELKAHPGSLILGICIAEIAMYYGYFWMMLRILDILEHPLGFNMYVYIYHLFNYLSGNSLHFTQGTIFTLTTTIASSALEISMFYYAFISIDIVFLLHNPFYSPEWRTILYHIFALLLPLSIFLPFRVTAIGNTLLPSIELPLKNMEAQYIDITISSTVSILCIIALIYSLIRIRKFTISKRHKRIFKFKMVAFTIVGLIYCSASIAEDISVIMFAQSYNFNWLTVYVGCSSIIGLCGMVMLPIRMLEPGVWKFIVMKVKIILCCKVDKDYKYQITKQLEESKSYYSFVHTTLNGELAESILQGITAIIPLQEEAFDEFSLYMDPSINQSSIKKSGTSYISHTKNKTNLKDFQQRRRFSNTYRNSRDSLNSNARKVTVQYIVKKQSVKITEYEADIFESIREHFNIKNKDLLASVDPVSNKSNIFSVGEGEGRSGSFFIFTFDKQFIIKTISPHEMTVFLKFLPRYQRRLTALNRSLISKIYGAFSVKMRGVVPVYVVLMENSLPIVPGYELEYIFDLKGSLVNRIVKPPIRKGATLKDLNYLDLRSRKHFLRVKDSIVLKYKEILREDVKLLNYNKLMDYSLLFGVAKCGSRNPFIMENSTFLRSSDDKFIYFFSIIDYFQCYTIRKRFEHYFKSLTLAPGKINCMSCVSPKMYADRFLGFIENQIFAYSIEQMIKIFLNYILYIYIYMLILLSPRQFSFVLYL